MAELYRIKDDVNLGQVGDIKQSMLTEAQFQTIHGASWTLMDGKNIAGSSYATITGNTTLPDARGQFLRGKNNGRTALEGNTSGEVNLGTEQFDAFQGHEHGSEAWASQDGNGANNTHNAGYGVSGPFGENVLTKRIVNKAGYENVRLAAETRPRNITINFFVKID